MSNELPLTPFHFETQVNDNCPPNSFPSHTNESDSLSVNHEKSEHVKPEDYFDLQPTERAGSFINMEPSPKDTATTASNSRKATPTEFSVQKKTIKKLRNSDEPATRKKTLMTKLRQTRKAQDSNNAEDTVNSSLMDVTYKFSSKKRLGQIMVPMETFRTPTFEEKDTAASSPCASNRGDIQSVGKSGMKTMKKVKTSDRSVCFLNKMPTEVTKMNFSGLNVFVEDDEGSLSLPLGMNTTKFVVEKKTA